MRYEPRFDIFTLFLLLGVSQGLLISWHYLVNSKDKQLFTRLYGLTILTITISVSEILLNYSGVIVKVIRIENYSEPFTFLVFPLAYLTFKAYKRVPFVPADKVHFIPFIFYFIYCILYFIQSPEFKYNNFVYAYQPDWNYIKADIKIPHDPLAIRSNLSVFILTQNIIYIFLTYYLIKSTTGNNRHSVARLLKSNTAVHFAVFVLISAVLFFVKINFERDLGDYIIGTLLSVLLYAATVAILIYAGKPAVDVSKSNTEKPKYEKSSLTGKKKEEILAKVKDLMVNEKYFTRNTLTLADVSKKVNEPPHHVSQVINEKLQKSFFDLLSVYRVEEAKQLIAHNKTANLTIEEIAEMVGYNSKAAFNKAFRKNAGQTPSEYRKNLG